jgi:hypothetical protein
VPIPQETLAFIADLADELADMADEQGHELLCHLLRMAVLEAEKSTRAEIDHSSTGKRVSYH